MEAEPYVPTITYPPASAHWIILLWIWPSRFLFASRWYCDITCFPLQKKSLYYKLGIFLTLFFKQSLICFRYLKVPSLQGVSFTGVIKVNLLTNLKYFHESQGTSHLLSETLSSNSVQNLMNYTFTVKHDISVMVKSLRKLILKQA